MHSPLKSIDRGVPRYDSVTLALHALLAVGVVGQLLLSLVMHVPAGVGLGVRDWHRQAFEVHARLGLGVAVVCTLHWLWLCVPASHPGVRSLFPWTERKSRELLAEDLRALLRIKLPGPRSPLIGAVHGLGLAAVTGSAAGGVVNYLGYFVGAPVPTQVLHWVARCHITLGYLIGAFVVGHGSMATRHWSIRYRGMAIQKGLK
ncbi:MAG TPA: cytochrome b/b6 domain-containing protein [Steroidobacteraceae bacterium]|jgi:cytochrome b561|nr:cytochrome b/b6 domain-containing protein [Steroidobacteraceae bacterium]